MPSVEESERLAAVLAVSCEAAEACGEVNVSVPLVLMRAIAAALTTAPAEAARPPLTGPQMEVYGALRDGIANGVMPTTREVAKALGRRSVKTVARHFATLARKGYIVRVANQNQWFRAPITLVPPVLP